MRRRVERENHEHPISEMGYEDRRSLREFPYTLQEKYAQEIYHRQQTLF